MAKKKQEPMSDAEVKKAMQRLLAISKLKSEERQLKARIIKEIERRGSNKIELGPMTGNIELAISQTPVYDPQEVYSRLKVKSHFFEFCSVLVTKMRGIMGEDWVDSVGIKPASYRKSRTLKYHAGSRPLTFKTLTSEGVVSTSSSDVGRAIDL